MQELQLWELQQQVQPREREQPVQRVLQLQEQQAELENKEYTANAGGGAVSVTMNGKHEIVSLKLAEEVVDPDDIEMLQDLIVAALNEVNKQIAEANDASMSSLAGGMGGLGGLF